MCPSVRHSLIALLALPVLLLAACGENATGPVNEPPVETRLPADPAGIELPGTDDDPALAAVVGMTPSPVPPQDRIGELLATRLEAWIAPNATVAEVNAALDAVGAKIVSMRDGVPLVTLVIDAVTSAEEALVRAEEVQAQDAFLLAMPAHAPRPVPAKLKPDSSKVPSDTGVPEHLRWLRMPAAWNALPRATTLNARVPVLVMDLFSELTPHPDIPAMTFPAGAAGGTNADNHGWHVAGIVGAAFDGTDAVGVHPSPATLLDLQALPIGGLSWGEMAGELVTHFPAEGNFVVSTSLGWPLSQGTPAGDWKVQTLVEGATLAWAWRIQTQAHWDRFLHLTAAGNEAEYAGNMVDARIESCWTIAHFFADPRELFAEGALSAGQSAALDAMVQWVETFHPQATVAQPNVMAVGSSDFTGARSAFSNLYDEIRVIGEDVLSTCRVADADCTNNLLSISGTSMATPQVAGLAAWMWNLDPGLDAEEVRERLTRAYTSSTWSGFTNAYTLTLSADPSLEQAAVRRVLLDVAGGAPQPGTNGLFDENDVELFLTFFESFQTKRAKAGGGWPDYSRYDLNGDNFTGGEDTAELDLDVDGLPQFESVTMEIEGQPTSFDETSVSDLDCLCYYAYSSLYDGDEQARTDLLAEDCGGEPGGSVTFALGNPDALNNRPGVFVSVGCVNGSSNPTAHDWDWVGDDDDVADWSGSVTTGCENSANGYQTSTTATASMSQKIEYRNPDLHVASMEVSLHVEGTANSSSDEAAANMNAQAKTTLLMYVREAPVTLTFTGSANYVSDQSGYTQVRIARQTGGPPVFERSWTEAEQTVNETAQIPVGNYYLIIQGTAGSGIQGGSAMWSGNLDVEMTVD